jgi:hypothetical protein
VSLLLPRARDTAARAGPLSDGPGADDSEHSAEVLFSSLWGELTDIIGTAATATLLRRAARRAADDEPGLRDLVISKRGLDYHHELPERWRSNDADAVRAVEVLAQHLRPLLAELTGRVVLVRLEHHQHHRRKGLFLPHGDP